MSSKYTGKGKGVSYRDLSFMGFPDYRVGTDGSCWSKKQSWLGPAGTWKRIGIRHAGEYLTAQLMNHSKRTSRPIHWLVLEAFVGPRPKGMLGCHNNGSKKDNRISNLRWDTPQANADDRVKHGTLCCGEASHMAKLTEVQVRKIRKFYDEGIGPSLIGEWFRIDRVRVWSIGTRKTWKHVA